MLDHHSITKFEETPVIEATLEDLDVTEVEEHLDHALRVNRYNGEARTPEEFLQDEHAVVQIDGRLVPTHAGMLMFGRRPQRFLKHATTSLAHYRNSVINSGDAIHLYEYGGNVRQQIDRVVAYLVDSMRHGYVLEDGGAQRQERPQYPMLALRELTVNAIAHRDYSISESSIRVTMLRNQIEWVSPGRLPPGVTIETILDHQFARNSTLLRLLFQRSYVEKMGQGLDTVFAECRRLDLPLPSMRETSNSFIIGIRGHDVARTTLTESQLQIVEILRGQQEPISAQVLADQLAGPDRTGTKSVRSIQLDLKVLIDEGLVVRIGQARATTYAIRTA